MSDASRSTTRKYRVWAEHGGVCHYCGRTPRLDMEMTLDHIWPVALGGLNARWNLVPACKLCNLRKGSTVSTCTCEFCESAKREHEARGLSGEPVISHKRARAAEARRARKRLGVRWDPATNSWGWYTDQMFNDPDLQTR